MTDASSAHSQTLSRGIRILEVLADARTPLTIDALSATLGLHRSVTYRLLRTLEDHRLVVRDGAGRIALGSRLAALAAGVSHDLQAAALPELTAIANELGMTCFLTVLDGDEIVTLVSVEPRHTMGSIAQRPGTRHPVGVGAPGKAIASRLPASQWPDSLDDDHRTELAVVREQGWASSHDEVITGLRAVAVPLAVHGSPAAALAVVYVSSSRPEPEIAARLIEGAATIASSV
ncbi:transcriptional regulator, IclR family [Plantibacter flavus]|uniref:IclR family transcriptional regulator n=1 Tax=Plantibacter flavus TaxID=150123 RepID=A0A3N2BZ47_9MICO|nr:IclR family transcriptional regulator [Plantibacter flavus]ROR80483.1 IclR family transcriptional regulator [Plantibacter flavus]SMG33948.1 transcriptional regulator, IclR family [Plantibacter flavus]